MVGIVLVSHSLALALEVANLARALTAEKPAVFATGGAEDGSLGTSIDRLRTAVAAADQGDGVIILADIGSSVLTAKLLVEDLRADHIVLADAPLVEGAVAAAVMAGAGAPLPDVLAAAEQARTTGKL